MQRRERPERLGRGGGGSRHVPILAVLAAFSCVLGAAPALADAVEPSVMPMRGWMEQVAL